MNVLPHYNPKQNYDMFGYPGFCCHTAIKRDDAAQAEECWRRGWLDLTCSMLIGTLLDHCDRHAPNVGKKLRELGPCKIEPRKPEEFIASVEVATA
jgi:hypothetical protein